MFYHETMGTMADESKLYKTFSFRVQDSTSGKKLVRLGTKVNFVWNYCNDVSKRSAQRVGPWVGKKQLIDLTKGSSKEIGLPSQDVQNVVLEFIKSRKAAGKPKLRWRVSRGAKRSLGWVPFTNQDVTLEGGRVKLRGETFRPLDAPRAHRQDQVRQFQPGFAGTLVLQSARSKRPRPPTAPRSSASTSASRPSLLRATAGILSKPISTAISRRSSPTLSDATTSGW